MDCCRNRGGAERERTITLELRYKDVLYRIRNMAYVEGRLLGEGADAECAAHLTKDVGEFGNVDRVDDVLSVVHADLVEMLYPYTKGSGATDRLVSDYLHHPESYIIELHVPGDFSDTTANLLLRLCREYMVCSALADWLSVTKPQSAANWAAKAEALRGEIASAKGRSMKKHRIKPFPAW